MKKIVLLLTAICMSILLTGCMSVEVKEKISKDGEISQTSKIYLNKEAYLDSYEDMTGVSINAEREAELDKQLVSDGYEIETMDGEIYYTKDDVTPVLKTTIEQYAKENQQTGAKGQEQYWETGMRTKLSTVYRQMLREFGDGTSDDSESIVETSYILYSIEFDYNIKKIDPLGKIDPANPKKATWKITFAQANKGVVIYAYCDSDIKVSGVKQGASYNKGVTLHFEGAAATYKGQPLANDTYFNKHGQHTVLLKAPSGEQRTVTFFVDKKKPAVKGIKKGKTYKQGTTFTINEPDSGIASVRINGKLAKVIGVNSYKLTKKGKNKIVIIDKAGNTRKLTVKVK